LYIIYIDGKVAKVYPYREQVNAYLYRYGFINRGSGLYFIDPRVEVLEAK